MVEAVISTMLVFSMSGAQQPKSIIHMLLKPWMQIKLLEKSFYLLKRKHLYIL